MDIADEQSLRSCSMLYTDPSYRRRPPWPVKGSKSTTFTRFHSVFKSSPHLAQYIERLSIQTFCSFWSWDPTPTPTSPYWDLIQLPTLRSLRLSNTKGLPPVLLSHSTATFSQFFIENITINDNSQTNGAPSFLARETRPGRSSPMDHLTILSLSNGAVCGLLIRDDTQHALGSSTFAFPAPVAREALASCGTPPSDPPSHTSSCTLPALRILTLRLDLTSCIARGYWPQLTQTSLDASVPSLERLNVTVCNGMPIRASQPAKSRPTPVPWPPFDAPQHSLLLPHLRRICFRLERNFYETSFGLFIAHTEGIFPAPREAGILVFEASKPYDQDEYQPLHMAAENKDLGVMNSSWITEPRLT
ncbi:hypothetical protein B0H14DRAFT_3484361 [Mycena olivaceomarginata]|nr:hypothetical protein B0H14DRAFT_3484361 [Mycena olivaceomarginata]